MMYSDERHSQTHLLSFQLAYHGVTDMQDTSPLPVLPKFEQSAANEDDGPKQMKELEDEGLIDT